MREGQRWINKYYSPQHNFSKTNGQYSFNGNSIVIHIEGDTGANLFATNTSSIIHGSFEYKVPVEIGVFSEETTIEVTLKSVRQGYLKIFSNHRSVMNWSVLYTLSTTGTLVLLDN